MSDDKKKFSKLVLEERYNQELEMKVQEFLSDKVIVDESEYAALKRENEGVCAWLHVVLDCADYTAGNCRVNEMVGAVLPKEVIEQARAALLTAEEQE